MQPTTNRDVTETYPQGWIQTRFGKFDPTSPVFDVRDIAHALGLIVRFNGHVSKFYSVAEHSLLVAGLMAKVTGGDPFEGLLHDATEAYLSDVPKPFKQLLPELTAWDRRMEGQLRKQFGLPEHTTPECKKADWYALAIEAHYLMADGGAGYYYPPGVYSEAMSLVQDKWRVQGLEPPVATKIWQDAYDHYSKNHEAITIATEA